MAVRLLQPFPRCLAFLGFKDNDAQIQYAGLIDGGGLGAYGSSKVPMPFPGIVKSLSIYGGGQTRSGDYAMDLNKNGVAMDGLVLSALQTGVNTLATSVPFVTGDCLEYAFTGAQVISPGYAVGVCAEIETATGMMGFGLAAPSGGITVGNGKIGGAFGNGIFQDYAGPAISNTYSLCAVEGAAVSLVLERFNLTPPSGGAWTAYLLINGVLQDGSGGTIDTSCVLDDTDPGAAIALFTVPLVLQERYDIAVIRSGTNAAFDFHQVGVSVAVQPSHARQFMLCGGNNDTIPNTGITWKYVGSRQNAPTVGEHSAPVGSRGFSTRTFYVERSAAAGLGKSATYELLRNQGGTDLLITIGGAVDQSGSATGHAGWFGNNLITIQIESTGSPSGGQLHWGIGAEPLTPVLGPIAWLEWNRTVP